MYAVAKKNRRRLNWYYEREIAVRQRKKYDLVPTDSFPNNTFWVWERWLLRVRPLFDLCNTSPFKKILHQLKSALSLRKLWSTAPDTQSRASPSPIKNTSVNFHVVSSPRQIASTFYIRIKISKMLGGVTNRLFRAFLFASEQGCLAQFPPERKFMGWRES